MKYKFKKNIKNKLSIITPCSRINNLTKIANHMKWNLIHEWIIIIDDNSLKNYILPSYNKKIKYYAITDKNSIVGNAQRNYGLINCNGDYIYFLDDDNIIHENFWNIYLKIINLNKNDLICSFDQLRNSKNKSILRGNNIKTNYIDTAQVIISKSLIKDNKWILSKYNADGIFFENIYNQNRNNHIYINEISAYYNFLENR